MIKNLNNFLLFSELTRVNHRFNRYIDTQLKDSELSRAQYTTLYLINNIPGITQQAIARKLNCSHVAVGRHLLFLERRAMVKHRSTSKSKRSHKLYITPTGQLVIARVATYFETQTQAIFKDLNDTQSFRANLQILDKALIDAENAAGLKE